MSALCRECSVRQGLTIGGVCAMCGGSKTGKAWFTSDTHFGHTNIIGFCNRPFTKLASECTLHDDNGDRSFRNGVQGKIVMPCRHPDIELHDRTLIGRWNETVAPEDTIYHLGDFAFGNLTKVREYARQLNGKKVLVLGNHDRLKSHHYEEMGFLVRKKLQLGQILLEHYPVPYPLVVPGIQLCGHVHESWTRKTFVSKPGVLQLNVGVDVWRFRPVSLYELGLSEGWAK